MTEYFIALDVHCAFSELAAMTGTGKLVRRDHCPTTIPALAEALKAVRRPRRLTFEEGPLADWLTRELRSHVDELVVCEPQRNHWIARDGDKDDPIDARKLADLYRGGYLKAVHQPGSLQRSLLKQHVSLYHDRVGERVRQGNQLVGPWRFKSKSALWRYCGIGLERRHSGAGPTRTRLSHRGNRKLKNILLGAARSAIAQADNPFADKFRYWTEEEGLVVPNARRNVARSIASTLWSLWKTGERYNSQYAT